MEDVYRLIAGGDAPEWRRSPPLFDCAALVFRVRQVLPEAKEADITSRAGYALARLRTLSKKSPCGCPDDERVKKALWLCLGAAAFPNDPKRTRARLREAAEAALRLTHGAPPKEREALRSRLGETADAMARLLSFAMNQKGG
jgi:hypothetical protein